MSHAITFSPLTLSLLKPTTHSIDMRDKLPQGQRENLQSNLPHRYSRSFRSVPTIDVCQIVVVRSCEPTLPFRVPSTIRHMAARLKPRGDRVAGAHPLREAPGQTRSVSGASANPVRPPPPNSGAASKNDSSSSAESTPREKDVGNLTPPDILSSFKKALTDSHGSLPRTNALQKFTWHVLRRAVVCETRTVSYQQQIGRHE